MRCTPRSNQSVPHSVTAVAELGSRAVAPTQSGPEGQRVLRGPRQLDDKSQP